MYAELLTLNYGCATANSPVPVNSTMNDITPHVVSTNFKITSRVHKRNKTSYPGSYAQSKNEQGYAPMPKLNIRALRGDILSI